MNDDIARDLDFKIVTEIKQGIAPSTAPVHCQEMKLSLLQFCLNSRTSAIHLAPAVLEQKHDLDQDDDFEDLDSQESQLDLDIDQLNENQDPMNVSNQLLWNQAQQRDKFTPRILKMLRDGDRYHSGIPLAECEERDKVLYFRDRKYVPKSDRLRLRIIQSAHDSVPSGHSGRSKRCEILSRFY